MQQQLRDNGYSDEQVSAYAAAGGLPYLDNTDTVFGQVYARHGCGGSDCLCSYGEK